MSNVFDWLLSSGLQLVVIIVVAYIIQKFSRLVIKKIVSSSLSMDEDITQRDHELRENTLVGVLSSVVTVLIWIIAIVAALLSLGVDLAPIIAGAGVLGLAVSFGAQDLMKDFIAGFFIILENQYRIGDVVKLDSTGGKVEDITMRITSLRDLDGNIHHVQNGSINVVTNKTMDFSKINMNIGVSYSSDIDKVEKVINEVGESLTSDAEWQRDIIEQPRFLRVVNFSDSAVNVKIIGKTIPERQWAVAGELRRRIKKAFEKEGIEIPFNQIVVHKSK